MNECAFGMPCPRAAFSSVFSSLRLYLVTRQLYGKAYANKYSFFGNHEIPYNKNFCGTDDKFNIIVLLFRPPLWSSGQSFWLQIQRSRVRSPALPDFLSSSGSGTGSTQPREP